VCPDLPPAVELRSETEGDRASCCAVLVSRAEAKVLPLPHGGHVAELAARDEERHARVAEAEGREPAQLVRELQRARTARDDGVDGERRTEVVVGQQRVGLVGERGRKRLDAVRLNRKPRRSLVPAVALELLGALAQRRVEIEAA